MSNKKNNINQQELKYIGGEYVDKEITDEEMYNDPYKVESKFSAQNDSHGSKGKKFSMNLKANNQKKGMAGNTDLMNGLDGTEFEKDAYEPLHHSQQVIGDYGALNNEDETPDKSS